MKYILFCALFLLGCYDEFYNPATFSALASRHGFKLNGNYVECAGETKIRSLHLGSEATGSLRFQKSSWVERDKDKCQINMYFIADTGKKEAYNSWLVNSQAEIETVLVEEKVEKPAEPKRFELSD